MILYKTEEEAEIGRGLQEKMVQHALELDGTCECVCMVIKDETYWTQAPASTVWDSARRNF